MYLIEYHSSVTSDLRSIDKRDLLRIKFAIEKKLFYNPEIFGKPLRKSLKGYRVLRVGKFRIVFCVENNTVKILAIKHRSKSYK